MKKYVQQGFEYDLKELAEKLGIPTITDLDVIFYDSKGKKISFGDEHGYEKMVLQVETSEIKVVRVTPEKKEGAIK